MPHNDGNVDSDVSAGVLRGVVAQVIPIDGLNCRPGEHHAIVGVYVFSGPLMAASSMDSRAVVLLRFMAVYYTTRPGYAVRVSATKVSARDTIDQWRLGRVQTTVIVFAVLAAILLDPDQRAAR